MLLNRTLKHPQKALSNVLWPQKTGKQKSCLSSCFRWENWIGWLAKISKQESGRVRPHPWLRSVTSVVSNSCNPMACSPPGSTVHGILQARTLGWVSMPSSRGSPLTQESKQHLRQLLNCRQTLYLLSHLGSLKVRSQKSQCSLGYLLVTSGRPRALSTVFYL